MNPLSTAANTTQPGFLGTFLTVVHAMQHRLARPGLAGPLPTQPVPDGQGGLGMHLSEDVLALLGMQAKTPGEREQAGHRTAPGKGHAYGPPAAVPRAAAAALAPASGGPGAEVVVHQGRRRVPPGIPPGPATDDTRGETYFRQEELDPAAGGLGAVRAPLPVVRTQGEALAALRVFEARARKRLPQLGGDPRDRERLASGEVVFRSLADLLVCFPCARSLVKTPANPAPGIGPTDAPGTIYTPVYEAGDQDASTPRSASIDGQAVITHRNAGEQTIRFTLDRCRWRPTHIYSDPVVEMKKQQMWARILQASRDTLALAGIVMPATHHIQG